MLASSMAAQSHSQAKDNRSDLYGGIGLGLATLAALATSLLAGVPAANVLRIAATR